MEITLTTPALLFPAISLLLLAYTNRFLALASLIRDLHSKYKTDHEDIIMDQLKNLRRRVNLIKNMQAAGIFSLFLCVLCMLLLFADYIQSGKYVFAVSLVMLMFSLGMSIIEIWISVEALNIRLSDIESKK
jgi:hypothetical protein